MKKYDLEANLFSTLSVYERASDLSRKGLTWVSETRAWLRTQVGSRTGSTVKQFNMFLEDTQTHYNNSLWEARPILQKS